tara:strand:- start:750 stop:1601 length:852 start_codon:yes stop_codon:yes gene_type:complete
MTDKTNPLAGHFRQPKLYMKLPSGGLFNTGEDLDISDSNEVAIFPMTAKDEILMKNPDALLNGEAVLQILKSCVPSVLDPKELTNIDVDAILMGIQSATYGDEMDLTTKCKYCDKELTGSTSIQEALDQIEPLEEVNIIEHDGLKVVLRPVKYKSTIEAGIVNFQTTRSLQGISDLPDDLDKLKIFNENFNRMAILNFSLICDSIEKIIIEGEETIEVTDRDQIIEFLENCEASIGVKIEEESTKISTKGISKDVKFACEDCGEDKITETKIILDPVNFFMAS